MSSDMNKRFRQLREALHKTQMEWANIIGLSRSGVTAIESGQRKVIDKHVKLLCLKPIDGKRINENWLQTGEGDMFIQLPEEDEVAAYVEELLADDGSNPLYGIIKEIMHTYSELEPKSQEVLRDFSQKLRDNLAQEKRED